MIIGSATAQAFCENVLGMNEDMTKMPGSPLAGGKIGTLEGVGKAAKKTFSLNCLFEPAGQVDEILQLLMFKGAACEHNRSTGA